MAGDITPLSQIKRIAKALIQLSDEQIRSYDYKDVPLVWRQMYTDATILGALTVLVTPAASLPECHSTIKRLDMALIVAGPTGHGRFKNVHTLIRRTQECLRDSDSAEIVPAKRRRLGTVDTIDIVRAAGKLRSPHVTNTIPVFSEQLSLDGYLKHMSTPLVITGGCKDWPAREKWRRQKYLQQIAGSGRVVPVEVGSDYTSSDWGQSIMPFDDFLTRFWEDERLELAAGESDTPSKALYLAQHDLFRQMPELLSDIEIPDYVYSAPEAPLDAPDYRPPGNEDGFIVNSWIGPAGTVSPAHTDPYFNCYGKLVG